MGENATRQVERQHKSATTTTTERKKKKKRKRRREEKRKRNRSATTTSTEIKGRNGRQERERERERERGTEERRGQLWIMQMDAVVEVKNMQDESERSGRLLLEDLLCSENFSSSFSGLTETERERRLSSSCEPSNEMTPEEAEEDIGAKTTTTHWQAKRLSGVYAVKRTPKRRRRLDFSSFPEVKVDEKENSKTPAPLQEEKKEIGTEDLHDTRRKSPLRELNDNS